MIAEIDVGKMQSICSVCGRTLLTGERTKTYVNTGGERKEVCDLCRDRVEHQGWVRAEGQDRPFIPKTRNRREGGTIRTWLRGTKGAVEEDKVVENSPPEMPETVGRPRSDTPPIDREDLAEEPPVKANEERFSRNVEKRSRRSVHAIPTSDAGKLERAVELFNETEHTKTVAGVARTLGKPNIAVVVQSGTSMEVKIVVAWELSWYRFRIDVSKKDKAVDLMDRGDELDEIPEAQREWNAEIDESGCMELIE